LEQAIRALGDAKTLDPSLTLDPDAEAHRVAADALVAKGKQLARAGHLDEAIRAFGDAKTLDPSLTLDPDAEAHRVAVGAAAEALVTKGQQLAIEGKVQEGLAAYAEARKLDPTAITPAALNGLCWNGSLANHADAVMESCEAAVLQEPENGGSRDSRGLARALTGNWQGAMEDFKFFLEWEKKEPGSDPDRRKRQVEKRVHWIAELGAGRNPFDAAVLQELRKE
jgi:tetratricopeptide (TPR) repeat protein